MGHPLVAAVAASMALTAQGGMILADAVTSGGQLPSYIALGVQGGAVVGLVYVVRAVLAGKLVVRETADRERDLARLIEEAHARERTLQAIIDHGGR